MKKGLKRISILCVCVVLLAVNFLNPVAFAASAVYELTFDNLFVFEQWANNANSGAVNTGTTGELTKDIEAGSFTLKNTSTEALETYTAYADTIARFYSMPVEENTEYTFQFSVAQGEGATQSFDAYVFYYNEAGILTGNNFHKAIKYGISEWNFTTPAGTKYIQIRFDNNQKGTFATVSDIRICKTEVFNDSKDIDYRKTFTYSSGLTYGNLPVLEKAGYVFAGWFTGPDGTGEQITEDTVMTAKSHSLYSFWQPVIAGEISIVSLPKKLDYCLGENINTEGLVVGVKFPDGTQENIDEGFTCSPNVLTETGTQTITVNYGGQAVEFDVNVKTADSYNLSLNNSAYPVTVANNVHTINYSGSAFNRFEINYTSDAHVKGEINFNGVIEEFFLEPGENAEFSSYIDGFISGTTQTKVNSITFTPLDKEFLNFTLHSLDLVKATNPGDSDGMVYLGEEDNNGLSYAIGIDLDWGGALTHMVDKVNGVVAAKDNEDTSQPIQVGLDSDFQGTYKEGGIFGGLIGGTTKDKYTKQGDVNLINAHDTGRLVQQSYYGAGDSSYEPEYYEGVAWPYNPVQGGNQKDEPSKIVDVKVTENEIYIKCRPLDWARDAKYITPSYMEAWYTIEDDYVRATCRFVDFSGYPAVTTNQELPAFYCVEPLNNFVYYSGGEAWSDSNTKVTRSDLEFWSGRTDQNFHCNENWAAFIGNGGSGYGIGLYAPGQTTFCSGIFPKNGEHVTSLTPALEDPTAYIGVFGSLTFQSYTPISYCYYMTTGNVDTIRNNFRDLAEISTDICDATKTNGFCDMCGKYVAPKLNENNIYEISNAGELYWFRDNVNNGNVNANAVLICDITDNSGVLSDYGTLANDTTGFRKWTPIGTSTNQYIGSFDGQGHTINGLYMDDSSLSYGGLFGCTASGAVIERFGIDNSYFKGNQCVGGICGQNGGTIENCYTFNIVVKGSSYVGGITGNNSGNIVNCYNTGIVYAIENYAGALAGSSSQTAIKNCYYLSDIATDGASVTQYGIGTGTKGSATKDENYKTLEQFASGEVAYLLQEPNPQQLWGQKTNNPGSAPIFDMSGNYRVNGVIGMNNYSLITIGDIDSDEDIDNNDFQQIINNLLSDEPLTFNDMLASDIDGDGYLDVIDCALMQLMANGFVDKVDVYLKGDYDCDGIAFTQADVKAIKKALINQHKLNTRQKYACDLNFDGVLNDSDREILTAQQNGTTKKPYSNIEEIIENRTKTANVIILCGQSNAYGASPLTQEVRNVVADTDFSNVKIKYTNVNSADGSTNWRVYYSNSEFETFRPGIGGQADSWFGPELGLAQYLATNEATKDEEWYIIKCTAAGTYLGGNWIYDPTDEYLDASNSQNILNDIGVCLADGTVGLVNVALNEIENIHNPDKINIRSFMWMQGESDSMVKEWADQYGGLQNVLVNKMRTAFGPRDNDGKIGFVDGAIAAYKSDINSWTYSDTVNTHKSNNASLWYVPVATTGNVINKTVAGLYTNPSTSSNKLPNSIWIDTSTCKSKLENGNENGESDGAHYCGESMLKIGQWFGYGMTQVY